MGGERSHHCVIPALLNLNLQFDNVQIKSHGIGQVLRKFFSLLAPGIPTDLRVTSVHDLTIMLTWKRPLTTAGAPDNSTLSYIVTYSSGGYNIDRQLVTTERAKLNLLVNKRYNIFVKAIQRDNHQIQGAWSRVFTVDTNNLGKFEEERMI